jgi:hypothetical protein
MWSRVGYVDDLLVSLHHGSRCPDGASRGARRPNDEEISIWNSFLKKHGWRDEASEELAESKKEASLGDCEDIQTWIDLHGAEDTRAPRALFSR